MPCRTTDPMASRPNDLSNKTSRRSILLPTPGNGSTGITEGHGPDLMFSNSFIKFIAGQFTQNLSSPRLATRELNSQITGGAFKAETDHEQRGKDNRHELIYEIDPDTGQAVLLASLALRLAEHGAVDGDPRPSARNGPSWCSPCVRR